MRPRFLAVATLVAIPITLAACGSSDPPPATTVSASTCPSGASRLTVDGAGTATGAPNELTAVLDVSVTQPSAAGALGADNATSASVISTLTRGGVPSADIQTTNVSLQPQYGGVPVTITGYQVTNTITAQLDDFATAGTLVDDVVTAGGDAMRIDSLTFSLTDLRRIEDGARTSAVSQARSHAVAMAAAAGDKLGPICSVSDTTQAPNPYVSFGDQASAALNGPAVALAAGTQQATAQVTMVYSLVTGTRASASTRA
jgi:uncharacterized protein